MDTSSTNQTRHQILNRNELLSSQQRLDLMAVYIQEAERMYYQKQSIFDGDLSQMWKNHRQLVRNQGMTTTLINLMQQRLNNITNRWRDLYHYRVDYYLRNAYDDTMTATNTNDHPQHSKKTDGFLFNIIIRTKHSFNNQPLQLLCRGPSYVLPCQMYISSSYASINDVIKRQYAPLRHRLTNLFSRYKINIALSMEIQKKVYDEFKHLFSISIPSNLRERALYEKKLIQSIRSSLQKNNLLLRRTADNRNMFYIGDRHEFQMKGEHYLDRSFVYKILIAKNDQLTHEEQQQERKSQMKEMIESMNLLLEELRKHKSLDNKTINQLRLDASQVQLPYAYFLPDISQVRSIRRLISRRSLVIFFSCSSSSIRKIDCLSYQ